MVSVSTGALRPLRSALRTAPRPGSGLDVAQQNAEQGVNVIKTAEGALNEVNSLLRQMRDLAVNAASDSNNNDDSRSALQAQVNSAIRTINEIANNPMYGSRQLLNGSAGTLTTVVNTGDIASASLSLGTETAGYVDVDITTIAEAAVIASNFNTAGTAITGAGQAVSASVNAINAGGRGRRPDPSSTASTSAPSTTQRPGRTFSTPSTPTATLTDCRTRRRQQQRVYDPEQHLWLWCTPERRVEHQRHNQHGGHSGPPTSSSAPTTESMR